MRFLYPPLRRLSLIALLVACAAGISFAAEHTPQYKNFSVAIYIPVQVVHHFADSQALEREWNTISHQLKVDKVYIETTRARITADADLIEKVKAFFVSKGVQIAGGMTFEAGGTDQYESYCYTDPKDREFVKNITEFTARHFDEIILDDFFFVTTKYPSDIAAKGNKSWTEFRLKLMDEVARDLLVGPAKAINPKLKFVVKYPNWYEHFQGLGFDLAEEPKIFDGIYTGTETRDPAITDQHLQQYESYEIVRYFENIAPGRNGGGWVDTFDIRYVDRYPEQLWDTMFAKAREMTLFFWGGLLMPAHPGDRGAWAKLPTSFNFDQVVSDFHQAGVANVTMAGIAARALEQADAVVGKLGRPVGVKSYKPHHSMGEDFLHNFLGNVGIPIDLQPEFPTGAPVVLLTESASYDPEIVAKIKGELNAGHRVVITSGLLHDLQGKGIEDIVEAGVLDKKALVRGYSFAYGSGSGTALGNASRPVLLPQVHFLTNDAWPIVRGETDGNGFPVLLADHYARGTLYVLTIPDDPRDLYEIPREALTAIKSVLLPEFDVQVDSPAQVALFTYDNQTFIVESYLPNETEVKVSLPVGYTKLRNLATNEVINGMEEKSDVHRRRGPVPAPRVNFAVHVLPHSFIAFAAEK